MSGRVTLTDDLLRQTLLARAANRIDEDSLVDEITEEMARTSQARPAWASRLGWPARLGFASVAVVAFVAFVLVVQGLNPAINQIEAGIGGPDVPALAGGRYRSTVFEPAVTFTVPDRRWAPAVNLKAEIRFRAIGADPAERDGGSLSLVRIENVMGGGVCGYGNRTPWPSTATDPASFVTWLQGRLPEGLGSPRAIAIGGRDGLVIEFHATTTLRQECDFGLLLSDVGTAGSPRYAEIPVDGRRVRLAVLAVSGALVVVITEGGWMNQFDVIARDADALISSLVFD